MNDLKFALRSLAKSPGFTAVAVLTLALGIGANTTIFSVLDAALLRPLPYPGADRLVRVQERTKNGELAPVAYRNFSDWSAASRCFASAAAIMGQNFTLTGHGEAEVVPGAKCSAAILRVLTVPIAFGRDFLPTDDVAGAKPVAILSDTLWRRSFGAERNAIGNTLTIDGRLVTVVGVLPAGFQLPLIGSVELLIPAGPSIPGSLDADRGVHRWDALARLAPTVALGAAQAELDTLAARLANENPGANSGAGIVASGLQDNVTGGARPLLWLLAAATGVVLLIVGVNLANLQLARAASRRHDLAVRTALGATRWRLMRQMLVESLVLAGLGGGLGWLAACWSLDVLTALRPASLALLPPPTLNLSVGGFTLGVTLAIGLALGASIGWRSGRIDPAVFLKSGGGAGAMGFRRSRLRGGLVIGEMALAVLLTLSAGLLGRSFARLMRVDTGLQPAGVMTMQISLPAARYPEPAGRKAFFSQLVDRVRTLPWVDAAGAIDRLPLSGDTWKTNYWIIGDSQPRTVEGQRYAECAIVAGDYFRSMGIPLRQGQLFSGSENQVNRPTIVIDETIARKCWPEQNAVGHQLELFGTSFEVVGIVGAVRPFGREADVLGQIYLAQELAGAERLTLTVRGKIGTAALVAAVRGVLRSIDPQLALDRVRPMVEIAAATDARRRFALWLFGAFAIVAAVLAAGGLYAVLAQLVAERTREIGIRVALGGRAVDVLWLIVSQGMSLAGLGLVLGVLGGAALTRFLASELYRTAPLDQLTFSLVPLALATVALIACWIPARRAMRVNPVAALRAE